MENIRQKFIKRYLDLLENKWNYLTDKERNDVIYLRNQKSLSTQNFNKLKELAERFNKAY